jgi:hypothetical protein
MIRASSFFGKLRNNLMIRIANCFVLPLNCSGRVGIRIPHNGSLAFLQWLNGPMT